MLRLIDFCPTPRFIVWDITYACALRCVHCYSESGRRPSRQLNAADLYRVTDAMIAVHPKAIVLAGGEPLLVKELFSVAQRMVDAGVEVFLYTGGWGFVPAMLPSIMDVCARVTVSIDGATADVHDRIRGRAGAFERAMGALGQLDRAVGELRRGGRRGPTLGVDFVVMQSNVHQLRDFCVDVVPRFAALSYVSFGAVIPTGLASRPSFAEQELLSEEQVSLLGDGRMAQELQSLAPPSVTIHTTDNRMFQLHPDLLAAGMDIPPMQVEPDGKVRAMPIYEGTVGSLLSESVSVLWERAMERWSDPFVVETLRPAITGKQWAEATRRIDHRFGSAQDTARIARRPTYTRQQRDG